MIYRGEREVALPPKAIETLIALSDFTICLHLDLSRINALPQPSNSCPRLPDSFVEH